MVSCDIFLYSIFPKHFSKCDVIKKKKANKKKKKLININYFMIFLIGYTCVAIYIKSPLRIRNTILYYDVT